jgi:hypothetical protein
MPVNNWKVHPRGSEYLSRIYAEGRSDVLWRAGYSFAPKVQAVFNRYSAEYGWGDPGTIGIGDKR